MCMCMCAGALKIDVQFDDMHPPDAIDEEGDGVSREQPKQVVRASKGGAQGLDSWWAQQRRQQEAQQRQQPIVQEQHAALKRSRG